MLLLNTFEQILNSQLTVCFFAASTFPSPVNLAFDLNLSRTVYAQPEIFEFSSFSVIPPTVGKLSVTLDEGTISCQIYKIYKPREAVEQHSTIKVRMIHQTRLPEQSQLSARNRSRGMNGNVTVRAYITCPALTSRPYLISFLLFKCLGELQLLNIWIGSTLRSPYALVFTKSFSTYRHRTKPITVSSLKGGRRRCGGKLPPGTRLQGKVHLQSSSVILKLQSCNTKAQMTVKWYS